LLCYKNFQTYNFVVCQVFFENVFISKGEVFISKKEVFIGKKAFVIFFTHLCEKYYKASFRLALLEVLFNQGRLIFKQT
jgi:hypothetical protein